VGQTAPARPNFLPRLNLSQPRRLESVFVQAILRTVMTLPGTRQSEPSARLPGRRLLIAASLLTTTVFLIAAGASIPRLPILGAIGTVFESIFSLHLVIAGFVGLVLAVAAWRRGAGSAAVAATAFAVVAIVGATIPLLSMVRAARFYGADISWIDHLQAIARFSAQPPNQTVLYGMVGEKKLYADVYLPANPPAGKSAPVLVMHGGGFIHGHRSMMRVWDRWFTARGYTVFDIDYRLAPPPTWNQAAQDGACAMAWIAAHADTYQVNADRMLLAGQSAGAGLALQIAYGLGDGTVRSSCGGTVPQPKAVFALYPPDDFALGWNMRARLGPSSARTFLKAYIGGSPEDFPDRYQAVSAIFHARPGLPPTLIAAGRPDHLVPFEGHLELVEKLNRAGVPNELIAIPYSEHAYDVVWGSLGGQITRNVLEQFLNEYLPAMEPR
jgi:acetyl esterase/lipase